MPITGTPAQPTAHNCNNCEGDEGSVLVTPTPVSCNTVGILSTEPTALNGNALRTRLRSVSLQQGQCATIAWTLHDQNGKPVDLTGCGFASEGQSNSSLSEVSLGSETEADIPPKVLFRMREYIATNSSSGQYGEVEAVVTDVENGKVSIALPASYVQLAGVYFGEVAVVETTSTGDCCVVFSNVFYVVVNKGLYGAKKYRGGPTIGEIRLHLRDSHPEESYLLDGLAFDNAEIAACIARPIEYWNEVPPPVRTYTTQSFPFRYHWLEAIIGELFRLAEETQRRNQLTYQAGGINIDDMNKERNYGQAAMLRMQAWREFVHIKKASLNIEDCWGGIGSDYGRYY
jgi:hypothetical protein